MKLFRKSSLIYLVIILAIIAAPALLSGCAGSGNNDTDTSTDEEQSDQMNNGSGDQEEDDGKILSLGEKGTNNTFEELAVTRITVARNLTVSTATELLQTGGPGESPESDRAPADGNEFLMITMTFKGKGDRTMIAPVNIKLEDDKNTEYGEVQTNGQGGVFNMQPAAKGDEASVTAVYEVPKAKKGLTFRYQPGTDTTISFKIR